MLRPGDSAIATKMDRAFRSLPDAIETLHLFRERGFHLHLLDLGGEVTKPGVSELIFAIMAAVAQFDRHRIRERIQDVRDDQRERDIYAGGRRPFGYAIVGDDTPDDEGRKPERHLVPFPEELAAIDEMRGMRAGGGSLRSIAERMTERGFALSHTGVRRILTDWADQPLASESNRSTEPS